jgi:virginiamycin B lyase
MNVRLHLLGAIVALTFLGAPSAPSSAQAPSQPPAALTGHVTSEAEGAMEGVVVSAKKADSNITVSVITDKEGRYAFPANRLEPGQYTIKIRAVGYLLDSPNKADVAAETTSTADLKLKKTKNLAAQLTNAEWLLSIPGTDEQKAMLLDCNGCHTYDRIVRSTHNAEEWTQTVWRMRNYAFQSQPIKPVPRMDPGWAGKPEQYRKVADYLATINLSESPQWEYDLKTLPRPSGRGTRVVITEYDLPKPTMQPHDVIVDREGTVWYTDFGEPYVGKLDPKTGKLTEIAVPELKAGYPLGALDLEHDPNNGTLWMGMMYQAALANFDPKSGTFTKFYEVPKALNDKVTQLNMLGLNYTVDGKVWTNNAGNQDIYRIDFKTGEYERFQPLKEYPGTGPRSIYGIAPDSKNNLYFAEFVTNYIGRIDAQTSKVSWFKTPTARSRPRRMEMDAQDRLWFAEYGGNRLAMFDTKTEKFTEWPLPTPWTAPYYVTWDKNGELWAGGMTTDRVVRLDPKTGEAVEYLLPRETNIRRVFVDNSTTPVTFWTGSNHGAAVVRVEPLD